MAEFRLSTAIYQLRMVLTGISPIIWRRLLVSSETTIAAAIAGYTHGVGLRQKRLQKFLSLAGIQSRP